MSTDPLSDIIQRANTNQAALAKRKRRPDWVQAQADIDFLLRLLRDLSSAENSMRKITKFFIRTCEPNLDVPPEESGLELPQMTMLTKLLLEVTEEEQKKRGRA